MNKFFSLLSVIQIHLRHIIRKAVSSAFVDFRNAFPSVHRNLLWDKVHEAGISSKLIRTIAYFCNINCDDEQTKFIKIS